jgi:hypothetical protein
VALVSGVVLALPGPAHGAAIGTWHTSNLPDGANYPASSGDYNVSTVYNRQLHVFNGDVTTGSLGQEWWDGRRWTYAILDGPGSPQPGHTTDKVGQYNAVTVYNGQLYVFTGDATTGSLRQDWWDGRRWTYAILDGPGSREPGHTTDNVGQYNVVTVYDGQLQVYTYDATLGSLRHDWWDGRRWNLETLDGNGSTQSGHTGDSVGQYNAVTPYHGLLYVFTDDATTGDLRQDWWDGRRWNFTVLDGPGSREPGHTTDSVWGSMSAVVYGTQLHVFSGDASGTVDTLVESLRHDWWDGARWHFGILDAGTPCPVGPCPGPAPPEPISVAYFGASIVAAVFNGQLHVFSNLYVNNAPLGPFINSEWLEQDWWDGTRWNHTTHLDYSGYEGGYWPDPDDAVAVYNGQLHVFTSDYGLVDVWWG